MEHKCGVFLLMSFEEIKIQIDLRFMGDAGTWSTVLVETPGAMSNWQ